MQILFCYFPYLDIYKYIYFIYIYIHSKSLLHIQLVRRLLLAIKSGTLKYFTCNKIFKIISLIHKMKLIWRWEEFLIKALRYINKIETIGICHIMSFHFIFFHKLIWNFRT